jgi:hypothetical protein
MLTVAIDFFKGVRNCVAHARSLLPFISAPALSQQPGMHINEQEYFEMPGLNVMVFHDTYPEGHQGGITLIQNGIRLAANGDIRLEPEPGQWQPTSKSGKRSVDLEDQSMSVACVYPNPEHNRTGFNPIVYPDLNLAYTVHVKAEGASFRIIVDFDEAIPAEWVGKVGFNLELFPGDFYGKIFYMDGEGGIFPRQLNGPVVPGVTDAGEVEPLATGKVLTVAPETETHRITFSAIRGDIELRDGTSHHNNSWMVVRTTVPEGATQGAVEWLVTPNPVEGWTYGPVIHVSQVGYHTQQEKIAVIECDLACDMVKEAVLKKIQPSGEFETVLSGKPAVWGQFIRYQYGQFDFSDVVEPGMYVVSYGEQQSEPFKIGPEVFDRHVWQPTLEYFLPVQMCHMRVNDRYRVWHGLCHMDDAVMAPENTHHFDGYEQGPKTLTKYKALEHVPGLNMGGWHDAGDYDVRVESQAGTVRTLALAYEAFDLQYDETSIDQETRIVELHRPDGKPDALQQIEHGVLSILGGYKNLGRLFRGIICKDLRQYVMLGDGSTMTDNRVFNDKLGAGELTATESSVPDDRWVFTEENPRRELSVAASLACAARVLKGFNDALAADCLGTAEELLKATEESRETGAARVDVLAELILATNKPEYKQQLIDLAPVIREEGARIGWVLGRVMPLVDGHDFRGAVDEAVAAYGERLKKDVTENPFGVPYRPNIWGAGWHIQRFGVEHYYWHKGWPERLPMEPVMNALNFILGCHPGPCTKSFVSGVGSNSVTVGYGVNRADWSFIPGGVVSGTAYIRPDFPELKEWPYLWQQSEYVIGGGATNFMFLTLAAKQLLDET